MSIDELPPMDPELERLLAAERALPPVPAGLERRLSARLAAALGWGGGAGGAGLGLLGLAVAVLIVAGGVGLGVVAWRGGGGGRPETGQPGAPGGGPAARRDAHPAAERPVPGWIGDPARPDVAIGGRVVDAEGRAVPGARVVLTSNLSRAGVAAAVEATSDARGGFAFAPRRAFVYDVTAAAPGQGEGHARVDTLDPAAAPRPDALTVVLPGCAHALVGVVRDASGGGIAGAQVARAQGTGSAVYELGVGAATDERGAYTLCAPPGPLTAVVRADGYGAVTVLDTVLGRRQLDVELVPGATVVGRVVRAADGTPVAGAMVTLRPQAFPPRVRAAPAAATTDGDGRFRVEGVAPGRMTVFATIGEAFTPPPGIPVVLEPGRESGEVVVPLEVLPARVDGTVVEDGRPVAGAKVYAVYDGSRNGGGFPVTDADGHFWIRLVRPGPIRFAVDGHDVVSPEEHLAAAGRTSVVVEVRSRGAIRGVVVRGGAPVPRATIQASGPALEPSGVPVVATTDAAGRFELRGLPAGPVHLSATSYDVRAFNRRAVAVTLGPREQRDGVVVELDGAASIAGTVLDQDGAPAPRVAVRWTDARTGDLCDAGTGADGAFTCVMLAGGGDYRPLVRLDDASAIELPAAGDGGLASVHVADGGAQITGVVLRVRMARATLRGRVVDAGGAPSPDVTVRALEESTGYEPGNAPWIGVRTAITDADGRFTLAVWGEASYTVQARASSGAEASAAGVRAAGPEPVLHLGRAGRIVGTLVGFTGRPIVVVRKLDSTVDGTHAVVDGDHLVADGLTAGRYGVMAMHGAEAAGLIVEVRDGADSAVTIRARPITRLDARVVDHVNGGPVAGVPCTIAPFVEGAGVAWWGTAAPPTDADGRFTADAPTGSIEVTCRGRAWRHSDGAARVEAGPDAAVVVPVVVSASAASGGLGVRLGFAHAPVSGHLLSIVELRPGGAGERAGLRVRDVITALDGGDVTALTDDGLLRLVGLHAVGDVVRVTVRRDGATHELPVTVEGPWW